MKPLILGSSAARSWLFLRLARSSHQTPPGGAGGVLPPRSPQGDESVLARKSRRSDQRREAVGALCTLRIGSSALTQSRARHTVPQQVDGEKSGLVPTLAFVGFVLLLTPGCGLGGGGVTPVRTSFNKGVYHYANANYDEAIAEYRLALEEDEGDVRARFNLAVALEAKARRLIDEGDAAAAEPLWSEAENQYRALVEAKPDFLRAIVNLAACEYDRGLSEQATRRLEEAIARFGNAALPRLAMAAHQFKALREGNSAASSSGAAFTSILERVEEVLRRDPASVHGNMLYGDVHALLGREAGSSASGRSVVGMTAEAHFRVAREAYRKALTREPSDIATLMARGRLERAAENWAAAASAFERVIFIDADHFEARLLLSEVLTSEGKLEMATFNLWRARALDRPRNPRLSPDQYRRRLRELYEQLELKERGN